MCNVYSLRGAEHFAYYLLWFTNCRLVAMSYLFINRFHVIIFYFFFYLSLVLVNFKYSSTQNGKMFRIMYCAKFKCISGREKKKKNIFHFRGNKRFSQRFATCGWYFFSSQYVRVAEMCECERKVKYKRKKKKICETINCINKRHGNAFGFVMCLEP